MGHVLADIGDRGIRLHSVDMWGPCRFLGGSPLEFDVVSDQMCRVRQEE